MAGWEQKSRPRSQDATTASIVNGLVMVVHLKTVRQVTAAGFGVLLAARRQLLEAGLSLSLAGLSLKTRFVLYAWRMQRLFDEWQPAISRGRPLVAGYETPVQNPAPWQARSGSGANSHSRIETQVLNCRPEAAGNPHPYGG